MSLADASRRELRALMRTDKRREDGTPFTKRSLDARKAKTKRGNAVAKAARKKNR